MTGILRSLTATRAACDYSRCPPSVNFFAPKVQLSLRLPKDRVEPEALIKQGVNEGHPDQLLSSNA